MKDVLEPIARESGIALDELLKRIADALTTWGPFGFVKDERVRVSLDEKGALAVEHESPNRKRDVDDYWRDRLPVARRMTSDPIAKRALEALLPRVPPIDVPKGSIAEVFSRGALHGIQHEDGADRLEIVWTACEAIRETTNERRKTWIAARVRGRVAGRDVDIVASEAFTPDAPPAPLPAHPDWLAHVKDALAGILQAARTEPLTDSRYAVLWPLLQAALPDISPSSRAGWFATEMFKHVPPVVAGKIEVAFTESVVDRDPRSFGALKMVMRMTIREGAEIVDVKEQEIYMGGIGLVDLSLPAVDPAHPHVRGAIDLWREAIAEKLRSVRDPETYMPHDLVPAEISLHGLIATWLDGGPPGPRPERLTIGELAKKSAASIERVDPAKFHALDLRVLAAYRFGGWHVLLAPHVPRPREFEEDRMWIVSPEGESALILMSDPWNAPVAMTIDGDGVAFRGFSNWLRGAILAAKLDVEWDVPPDEDEYDEEDEGVEPQPTRRSVASYLRFRDGWREELGERMWDWRLQNETVADGFAFWQSGIFGFKPEKKRELEKGITLWHRFLTEIVDAGFVGQRPDPRDDA